MNDTPPPRWLNRDALAKYISVRVDSISRLQRAGKLPAPSYQLGPRQPRWDREKVDALFAGADVRSQSATVDTTISRVAQRILEEGPRRRHKTYPHT